MAQLPVNVNHWRNFLRVADIGSFSRVAEIYDIAQPAISRQMKSIEDLLGVELFNRSVQGVTLTDAGHVFYERAASILGQLEDLQQEISDVTKVPTGSITVGLPASLVPLLAAPLVLYVKKELPKVYLNIVVGTVGLITEALVSKRCDLGILFNPVEEPALMSQSVARDPLVLIGPQGGGLSPDRPFTPMDFKDLPLIFLGKENGIRKRVVEAFAQEGIVPKIHFEIESTSIIQLAEAGIAYCPLPSAILADKGYATRTCHCFIPGITMTWCLSRLKSEPATPQVHLVETWLKQQMKHEIDAGNWKASFLASRAAL
ncbi:LysR family transcriptional regulator [Antarctobacter sp.]|uniref:LysR family transcriptional regulator n=1 Tax=Antarctobacter sp. TaxID=1872577 RepID=UPI003A91F9F3